MLTILTILHALQMTQLGLIQYAKGLTSGCGQSGSHVVGVTTVAVTEWVLQAEDGDN